MEKGVGQEFKADFPGGGGEKGLQISFLQTKACATAAYSPNEIM